MGGPPTVSAMPTVTYEQATLRWLQGRHGIEFDPQVWVERIGDIGCTAEHVDAETVVLGFEPNRPDLLGVESLAWAMRRFLHGRPAQPHLTVIQGDIAFVVEPDLTDVRPVVRAAVVRGVDPGPDGDAFVRSLMDLQEKLHHGLGRRRRRASIGVHDLASLEPPFRVITAPGCTSFVPLASDEPMSIHRILTEHPKGVDHAHLLVGFERYPLILDANEAVLSFPPIINGVHTTVTESTRDFLIDCTGLDEVAVEASLLLVCHALAERGGTVESVQLTDTDGTTRAFPDGRAVRHHVPRRLIDGLVGLDPDEATTREALRRMGIELVAATTWDSGAASFASVTSDVDPDAAWAVDVPPWRSDILHPVDLVEEVAIGIGYTEVGRARASAPSTGLPQAGHHLRRRLKDAMVGMGMQEIVSLTLSNDEAQFGRPRHVPLGEVTRVTNPISVDHTLLRQRILPQLFELLATNRHHELPQRVWELGRVVVDHRNAWRLAWTQAAAKVGFADVRAQVQALMTELGAVEEEVRIEVPQDTSGPWLAGRAASVTIEGRLLGSFGEVDPAVSEAFELAVPIIAAEFDVVAVEAAIPDPVL